MNTKNRFLNYRCLTAPVLAAAVLGTPARAAEIALLAGYQMDPDVQISLSNQWPPGNVPAADPGDSIDLDDGSSWAIAINADYQNRTYQKIGLYYSQHSSGFDASAGLRDSSLDISFLHFTGTNIYPQSDRLSYFLVGGLGAAFYRPDDATLQNVTRFSAQIGGGANIQLSDTFLLQFDIRWLPTFFNSDTAIFCSGGCTISVESDTFNQVQLNAGLLLRF